MSSSGIRIYAPNGLVMLDTSTETIRPVYKGSLTINGDSGFFAIPISTNEKMFCVSVVVNSTTNTGASARVATSGIEWFVASLSLDWRGKLMKPTGTLEFTIYDR